MLLKDQLKVINTYLLANLEFWYRMDHGNRGSSGQIVFSQIRATFGTHVFHDRRMHARFQFEKIFSATETRRLKIFPPKLFSRNYSKQRVPRFHYGAFLCQQLANSSGLCAF